MTIYKTAQAAGLLFQRLALLALGVFAAAMLGASLAAAFGLLPWLTLPMAFGETEFAEAGIWAQLGVTALALVLLAVLPANRRILRLETSHRQFHMTMEDVARAYHMCHTADRAGVFTLSSEFDAVRERIAYLRDHPDLARLEPEVLEIAAQMSQQSHHLADVYSDVNVRRAKAFLKERQEEAEKQQDQLVQALHVCSQLRTWSDQVETEEAIVESQRGQLEEMLEALLPDLGYALSPLGSAANVTHMPRTPAAE